MGASESKREAHIPLFFPHQVGAGLTRTLSFSGSCAWCKCDFATWWLWKNLTVSLHPKINVSRYSKGWPRRYVVSLLPPLFIFLVLKMYSTNRLRPCRKHPWNKLNIKHCLGSFRAIFLVLVLSVVAPENLVDSWVGKREQCHWKSTGKFVPAEQWRLTPIIPRLQEIFPYSSPLDNFWCLSTHTRSDINVRPSSTPTPCPLFYLNTYLEGSWQLLGFRKKILVRTQHLDCRHQVLIVYSLKRNYGRVVMHCHVNMERILLLEADPWNREQFDGILTLIWIHGRQLLVTFICNNWFDVLSIPVGLSCIL